MRKWAERVPVSCEECGRVYVATPTADGRFRVTSDRCRDCGECRFTPVQVV